MTETSTAENEVQPKQQRKKRQVRKARFAIMQPMSLLIDGAIEAKLKEHDLMFLAYGWREVQAPTDTFKSTRDALAWAKEHCVGRVRIVDIKQEGVVKTVKQTAFTETE